SRCSPGTGSPVNGRSSRSQAASTNAATMRSAYPLRQAEDIEHASLRGRLLQVGHRIDEAERRRAVARIEITRNDCAGPAAHATEHRHVLVAVRAAIGDRLADDP